MPKYIDSAKRSDWLKKRVRDFKNTNEMYLVKRKIWFWVGFGVSLLVIAALITFLSFKEKPLPAHAENAFKKTLETDVGAQKIKLFYGKASYYDYDLKDAPGYSKTHLTAAVRDWPRGTKLRVCLVDNPQKCVNVRVNDYGPEKARHPDRIIDLSSAAFKELSTLRAGIVNVSIEVL